MGWRRLAAALVPAAALALALAATARAAPIATVTAPTPISGGRGWLVWSVPVRGGWGLEAWHAGALQELHVAPRPQPFDLSVGTDAKGRPVVTFSRCRRTPSFFSYGSATETGGTLLAPQTGAGCRLRVLPLDGGPERALPVPHPRDASDTTPSMWRGAVAFARHLPAHRQVWQVLLFSPSHPHRLTTLPHGAEPSCRGCREADSGQVEALSFRAGAVAFVWEPEGPLVSGEEAWEDRLDGVSRRSGRLAGTEEGTESCTGEGPAVEESYPLGPLAGATTLFPYYERGRCYKHVGTGLFAARAGALYAGSLAEPLWGLAGDGSQYFGIVPRVAPPLEQDPVCSTSAPCAIEALALPRLHRLRRAPRHPFV